MIHWAWLIFAAMIGGTTGVFIMAALNMSKED